LINKAIDEWKNDEVVWELVQKLPKFPDPTILLQIDKEGKIILEPEAFIKP